MKNKLSYLISAKLWVLAAALLLWPLAIRAQAPMSIRASADSVTLVMGDRVTVNVEVIKNTHDGALLDMPKKEKDYYGLEMQEITADSTELGNGRVELKYHIIFQAFDPSQLLTLPPFAYASQGDTVHSESLAFKVYPVDLSPELGNPEDIESLTVHPDEEPLSVPSRWYDYVPNWLIWVFIGLIALALAAVAYLMLKQGKQALLAQRKPTPPYELAVQRLSELKDRKLLSQGHVKQYYTELIDILRSYLEGRFGINAMELPSKMILKRIRENKEIHLSAAQMEQVLELADFVKFAAANPNPEEGLRTFNTISDFVESTKPAPEPTPEGGEAKAGGATTSKPQKD